MSGTELFHNIKQILLRDGIIEGEARALAFMLIEEVCQLSRTQILTTDSLAADTGKLTQMAQAIADGTPIQQVLGYAYFCGHRLRVTPAVLIPRPETEELVEWIAESSPPPSSILDIGTGSGCMAIALARLFPSAFVSAIDISDEALAVAQENTDLNKVRVNFQNIDILAPQPAMQGAPFDVIVSNPPYICHKEAAMMERNVLEHEPHLALFVPDDDPLLFCRTIAHTSRHLLTAGGHLYLEINSQYACEITSMLLSLGYADISTRTDQFGKKRFVYAKPPSNL